MSKKYNLINFAIFAILVISHVTSGSTVGGNKSNHSDHGVSLADWNIAYVSPMLEISTFVLLAGLLKIGFHHVPHLPSLIPESCILIIIGTAVGAFLYYGGISDHFRMETKTFLLFLLPPIVLEASFTLNDRSFRDHIGAILIYAILGTVINFLIIGFSMYGLGKAGVMGDVNIDQLEYLLFGALIVAVDPVAVLAIFQDIGVNQVLYFLVFGESLLNDAVTIVLYHMMEAFTSTPEINHVQVMIGIGSFFTVSLGGLLIGILFGIAACLLTRVTSHVRVAEPLTILVMAYMSYLCAELFHWSGIISMIGCGIIEAHYAFKNISKKSYVTVLYFIKMLSSCNDSIIFLFLGLELIRTAHVWNTGFICSALLLCLIARVISVFGLTFFVNLFNKRTKIKMADQFIMWYGGLRGAVCFALCNSLEIEIHKKNLFLTTSFVVILFTVFVQGITIKPVVKFCKIVRKDDSATTLLAEFQTLMFEKMSSALDAVIGQDKKKIFFNFDDTCFKRLLLKKALSSQEEFIEAYKEIALKRYKSVLGRISSGEIRPNKGIDNEGFYPIDEDECNMEEDLAKEVERELSTFDERGSQAESISRTDIVNLYRAMSKRSLGDKFIFDRDLKYHDIPEDQEDDEVETELKRSIYEGEIQTPTSTEGRVRKLSVPIMGRKYSSHVRSAGGAGMLKGAVSMNFDPSSGRPKRQRHSSFQLPSHYITPSQFDSINNFYSQPNSPMKKIQSKYKQKKNPRSVYVDVPLSTLGEVPEEGQPPALNPRYPLGASEPTPGYSKPRRFSDSSDDEFYVSFRGKDVESRSIEDQTKF